MGEEQEAVKESVEVLASVVSTLPEVGGPLSAILNIVLIFWPGEDKWDALERKIEDEVGGAFESYHATRELHDLVSSETLFNEYLHEYRNDSEGGTIAVPAAKQEGYVGRLDGLHQKLVSEREQLFNPPRLDIDKHGVGRFATFPSFTRYVTLHLAVLTELRRFPNETIDTGQQISDLLRESQLYLLDALKDKFASYTRFKTDDDEVSGKWEVTDTKDDLPLWFTRQHFPKAQAQDYVTALTASAILKEFVPAIIEAGTLFHFDGLTLSYPDIDFRTDDMPRNLDWDPTFGQTEDRFRGGGPIIKELSGTEDEDLASKQKNAFEEAREKYLAEVRERAGFKEPLKPFAGPFGATIVPSAKDY